MAEPLNGIIPKKRRLLNSIVAWGKAVGRKRLAEKLDLMLKDQFVKVGIVPQCGQIVIVLRANSKSGLQIQRSLQRLECQVDGSKPGASCGEAVMNMSGFRFTF